MRAVVFAVVMVVAGAASAGETLHCKWPGYPAMTITIEKAASDGVIQVGKAEPMKLLGRGTVGTGMQGLVYASEDEKFQFVLFGDDSNYNFPIERAATRKFDALIVGKKRIETQCK